VPGHDRLLIRHMIEELAIAGVVDADDLVAQPLAVRDHPAQRVLECVGCGGELLGERH